MTRKHCFAQLRCKPRMPFCMRVSVLSMISSRQKKRWKTRLGNVLRHNAPYLQLWPIDRKLVRSGHHSELIEFCGAFLKEPQQFVRKTAQIYADWPPDTYDLLELTDGRIFERYSKIHHIGER